MRRIEWHQCQCPWGLKITFADWNLSNCHTSCNIAWTNWRRASRGFSAIAELLAWLICIAVIVCLSRKCTLRTCSCRYFPSSSTSAPSSISSTTGVWCRWLCPASRGWCSSPWKRRRSSPSTRRATYSLAWFVVARSCLLHSAMNQWRWLSFAGHIPSWSDYPQKTSNTWFLVPMPRVGPGQSPSSFYVPTSPPSTLSFSIFYFSVFPVLTRFIYFIAFPSFPIIPFPGRMS